MQHSSGRQAEMGGLGGIARAVASFWVALGLASGALGQVTIHVSASGGSDANDGHSPASALATLTAGLARLVPGGTLQIASGTYAPSTGESFPAKASAGIRLRGAGVGKTFLDGQGSAGVLELRDGSIEIEDLTVANSAGDGIRVTDATQLTVRRVELRGHGSSGLWVEQVARLTPTLVANSVFLQNGDAGLFFDATGEPTQRVALSIRDSSFASGLLGVLVAADQPGMVSLDVDRSRFRSNYWGIAGNQGTLRVRVTSSAFDDNRIGLQGAVYGTIANSSFASNDTALFLYEGDIVNSILWGNDHEIMDGAGTVRFSLVEDLELDAMLDGGNNFSADPLLDANLQLQAGSPAIDRGSNAAALALGIAGSSDIDGDARSQDVSAVANGPGGIIDLGADEVAGERDRDGDSVIDARDNCWLFPNLTQRDTDGNKIGDLCECGDQSGDGTVNVLDLIAINLAIFEPARATALCDTNGDDRCDVLDIVGANAKIFGGVAICSRFGLSVH